MNRLLPLLVFAALCALLGFGIYWNKHHETNEVPSPLIGKPRRSLLFHFYTNRQNT